MLSDANVNFIHVFFTVIHQRQPNLSIKFCRDIAVTDVYKVLLLNYDFLGEVDTFRSPEEDCNHIEREVRHTSLFALVYKRVLDVTS